MITAAERTAPTFGRLEILDAYWRAANYLGAAQLYLRDNALLREALTADHIKPRILGHWGTQPGINLIYAHLNRLIMDTASSIMLVVGPGHGAPAVLANLFLEGTLGRYDAQFTRDESGIAKLVKAFSWPGGHASHITPHTPGAIHEGGELGYSLLHAYGAVFDNPDLIVACIVGDGEAETGALAASWHSNKFLDPVTCGAVLPILHLNGARLSGPTILGRMSDEEVHMLFRGYGYEPIVVAAHEAAHAHAAMWTALDCAHGMIRQIQYAARFEDEREAPRWPLIILRTPKGMTGPHSIDGKLVEGTFRSHGLPISDPAHNPAHLGALEQWLRSYDPAELFSKRGVPVDAILANVPAAGLCMGMCPNADSGANRKPLHLPDPTTYAVDVPLPGSGHDSAAHMLGLYLRDTFTNNIAAQNFRVFSPDETMSNKIDAVFNVTDRAFVWPLRSIDECYARNGRVMEILSEHACQGWLEGYLLTGRHGVFVSYEAFMPVVDSMVTQYAKWLKVASEVPWRKPPASLNYVLTSHLWRQDHNGYTHQGPGFVNTLLSKKSSIVRTYFPPDANTLLSMAHHCLGTTGYINLIIAPKQNAPQWLSMDQARDHCARGASIWKWAGDSEKPDVVMACAGDVPTLETLAAVDFLRQRAPGVRVRVVNVVDLFALVARRDHPHGLTSDAFERLFGSDLPVVFAFHGYPNAVHELLHHRPNPARFHVRGYEEEGATSTAFDIVVQNRMSRYHLALLALEHAGVAPVRLAELRSIVTKRLMDHKTYIRTFGVDLPEVAGWRWPQ